MDGFAGNWSDHGKNLISSMQSLGKWSARAALEEVLPRLSQETEALIDELLPSWRSSAA
jgi:hypothetical protein